MKKILQRLLLILMPAIIIAAGIFSIFSSTLNNNKYMVPQVKQDHVSNVEQETDAKSESPSLVNKPNQIVSQAGTTPGNAQAPAGTTGGTTGGANVPTSTAMETPFTLFEYYNMTPIANDDLKILGANESGIYTQYFLRMFQNLYGINSVTANAQISDGSGAKLANLSPISNVVHANRKLTLADSTASAPADNYEIQTKIRPEWKQRFQSIYNLFQYQNQHIVPDTSLTHDLDQFEDITTLYDSINTITSYRGIDKEIGIKMPNTVDIGVGSTTDTLHAHEAHFVGSESKFVYKVAEIDVDSFNPKNSLYFDINLWEGTNNYPMKLVFSNKIKDLQDLETMTIPQLIEQKLIFLRESDDKLIAWDDAKLTSAETLIANHIELTKDGKKFNLFVKPFISRQNQIDVKVDQQHKNGVTKFGLLDNTFSPRNIKHDFNGQTSSDSFFKETQFRDTTPTNGGYADIYQIENTAVTPHTWTTLEPTPVNNVYRSKVKVTNDATTERTIILYMGSDEEIEQKIVYIDGGKPVPTSPFKNDNNAFRLSTAGGIFEFDSKVGGKIQVDGFDISTAIKAKVTQIDHPFTWTGAAGNVQENESWFKVELTVPANIGLNVQGNAQEEPFGIPEKKLGSKILFEDPFPSEWANGNTSPEKRIVIEQFVDNSKNIQKIYGNIYANWMDPSLVTKGSPDDFWDPAHPFTFKLDYKNVFNLAEGHFAHASEDIIKLREHINPREAIKQLNTLSNHMSKYIKETLLGSGAESSNLARENDYYLLNDTNTAIGFVKKRFLDGMNLPTPPGSNGDMSLLDFVATLTSKYYNHAQLNPEEENFRNKYLHDTAHPNGQTIAEYMGTVVGSQGDDDQTRQMYAFVEPFMATLIVQRFHIEEENFSLVKYKGVGDSVSAYITSSSGNFNAINENALKSSTINVQGSPMNVLTVNGAVSTTVRSGKEQLGSIVRFVNKFSLFDRYYNSHKDRDIEERREFFKSLLDPHGGILDATVWKQASLNPQKLQIMVDALDSILKETLKDLNVEYKTLFDIIKASLTGGLNKAQAIEKTKQLFNNVVGAITGDFGSVDYKFFGRTFHSTFIENLAVGHNLNEVIKRYLINHGVHDQPPTQLPSPGRQVQATGNTDASASDTGNKFEYLQNLKNAPGGIYNAGLIVKIAVNNKFYNIDYFINGLSSQSHVREMVEELLNSDLERSILMEIPDGNAIVDFLSDPTKIASFAFGIVGLLMAIIGTIMLFFTFKKGKNDGEKIVVTRIIFASVIIVGVLIALFGIVVPMLGLAVMSA